MKPDPKRPYKAYAAALVAFLASLIASGILPVVAVAIITAVLAGVAAFYTPNPQVGEGSPVPPEDEATLF